MPDPVALGILGRHERQRGAPDRGGRDGAEDVAKRAALSAQAVRTQRLLECNHADASGATRVVSVRSVRYKEHHDWEEWRLVLAVEVERLGRGEQLWGPTCAPSCSKWSSLAKALGERCMLQNNPFGLEPGQYVIQAHVPRLDEGQGDGAGG